MLLVRYTAAAPRLRRVFGVLLRPNPKYLHHHSPLSSRANFTLRESAPKVLQYRESTVIATAKRKYIR